MTGFAREFYQSFSNRASDLLRELREDTAFEFPEVVEGAAREAAGALQRLLETLWNEHLVDIEVRSDFEEED